jgi:molecular chaperone GrpE
MPEPLEKKKKDDETEAPDEPVSEVEERDPAAAVAESASEPDDEKAPPDPLAEARAEVAKLKDAWMRTAADFDNFRKRSRREIDEARRNGREDLLRAVLPVFDNLERAIQSSQRAADVKAVADGLTLVLKQFTDALARSGIQRVQTVGQAFDPSVHEAIQQVETSEHAPGTVIAEVQPGYVQDERLVRAAMVVVAKPKAEAEPEAGTN